MIHPSVIMGENPTIMHNVELREGTVIGDDVYLDSGVKSSGDNYIGDRAIIRYDAIIARGVRIEPDVFISPQVMTENLDHHGNAIGGAHIGTGDWDHSTRYRVFVGTNATLAAGITICSGTVVGSKANVRKSITEPGVYVGNPARRVGYPPRVTVGRNFRMEPGVVLGGQPTLIRRGKHMMVPEGGITIGDDVWIGPNSVVMYGRDGDTYIGDNTKIGALCNIAHDCHIEGNTVIKNGSILSGLVHVEEWVTINIGCRFRERVKIGRGSTIGMGSNVLTDIPPNVFAWGNPCRAIRKKPFNIKQVIKRILP